MKCTVTLLIAVVVAVGGLAPATMAVDYDFTASDGSWDFAPNWTDPGGGHLVPGENDQATILVGNVCRVDTTLEKNGKVIVKNNSELRIEGTRTLEVHESMDIQDGGDLLIEGTGILELRTCVKRPHCADTYGYETNSLPIGRDGRAVETD